VVGHLAVEAKPTEPDVSELQVNLVAQPPFGTNAVAPYVASNDGERQWNIMSDWTCR
jgi:hypothetical protein